MVFVAPPSRRRRYARTAIAAFQAAGASRIDMAKSLSEIGLDDSDEFRGLAETGLFRETSPGRWYMDQDALADYRADVSRRILLALALALLLGGLAFAIGATRH